MTTVKHFGYAAQAEEKQHLHRLKRIFIKDALKFTLNILEKNLSKMMD